MPLSKILIVDDDQSHHFLTKSIIHSANDKIEVLHAYDGNEALNLLEEGHTPQVILLDITMPGLDGFGFLDKYTAAAKDKKIPVVMVSSSYDQKDKDRAFSYECVPDYICKPFSNEDVDGIAAYVCNDKQNAKNINLADE